MDKKIIHSFSKEGDKVTVKVFAGTPLATTDTVSMVSSRLDMADCQGNLKRLERDLENFSVDHSGHYPGGLSELVPDYCKALPTCPAARQDTYSASYRSHDKPDEFSCACQGGHHTALGVPSDYPQLTSAAGLISPEAAETPKPEGAPWRPAGERFPDNLCRLVAENDTAGFTKALKAGSVTASTSTAFLVCALGRTGMLQVLKAQGVDLKFSDPEGQNLLHKLAPWSQPKAREIVSALHQAGLDPKAADHQGRTPLHVMFEAFDPVAVGAHVLGPHCDIEMVTPPAMFAMAAALIENGADLAAKDKQGRTPLLAMMARGGPQVPFRELVLDYLVNHGADVNATDSQGKTALHYACANSDILSVRLLLTRGASAQVKDGQGATPAELATNKHCKSLCSGPEGWLAKEGQRAANWTPLEAGWEVDTASWSSFDNHRQLVLLRQTSTRAVVPAGVMLWSSKPQVDTAAKLTKESGEKLLKAARENGRIAVLPRSAYRDEAWQQEFDIHAVDLPKARGQ